MSQVEGSEIHDIVPDMRPEASKIVVLSVMLARDDGRLPGLTLWTHQFPEPRHLHRLPHA